ncbi:hypothetical protein Xen7305DRAFT_00004980 [Xenococcus sp. PCC 7305]|uniref:hypothetical protein n=1 Tax=Xenococcus sp. PCC 7305 TaxID=102125 RepID=UPI0002ACEF65|nr:hypothetical protein [Xenococcus sp. PCC 7305]ELS00797.1 hypothetical protein Xen7305DRAFT_00004980 [Xenococcus sp. PCC 7305]
MNQQNLKAYLNLIKGLLVCPRGEEWILLRQNEKLVNPELVEVMEQVANHLAMEGDVKAAKYLHNWAGKLHHILTETVAAPQNNHDKTNAYVELIQKLLNCPEGSEEEILAAHQELIGPELVKVMKQVASQMAAEGDQETASLLDNLATNLNRTWLHHHEFKPTFKKEIATDPWFEEDSTTQSPTETATKPQDVESPTPEETVTSTPQTKIESDQSLTQQLEEIADSLVKLETTLSSRLQPPNPLWYMEVLEKAETNYWVLTTDDIEHLMASNLNVIMAKLFSPEVVGYLSKLEKLALRQAGEFRKKTNLLINSLIRQQGKKCLKIRLLPSR